MAGWIKIHRTMIDHWINTDKRKYSRFEAWMDILLSVNYADTKVTIKNTVYEVKRGQSIFSLDTWSKRWNWNKSATRRFVQLLEKDGMIELKTDTQTTQLTVCNYARYQDERNANETQVKRKRNASETQTTLREERKKNKEEKETINIDSDCVQYLQTFNEVYKTNHTSITPVKTALSRVLKDYTIEQVCEAIKRSTTSDAWVADKLKSNHLMLLNQKNKGGQCDYVGSILNSNYKAEYKHIPKFVNVNLAKDLITELNNQFGLPLDWNEYDDYNRVSFIKKTPSIRPYFDLRGLGI